MSSQVSSGAGLSPAMMAKDLLVAGILAAAIFGTTLGFKTETAVGGLSLEYKMGLAASSIAIVVVGRLLLWLTLWRKGPGTGSASSVADSVFNGVVSLFEGRTKILGIAALLFALVFPFLPFADRYWIDLAILILTYIMLGWGLNIVVGLAGLLDLGYVAFYAIGAYSYALLAHYFGFSFWMCLPLAGILAAFWGIILGFPVLRLRGDYLAIVTLAFGEIIRVVLLNWYQFTGGPDGLSGIPRPTFFGLPFKRGEGNFADVFGLDYSSIHRIIFLYFLILALALLTNFVTNRLRRLPIGRAWEALREDEIACRSLGLNTTMVKLSAFAIGAMFAGFAGSFFATRQGFISPESFTFIESALILAIVVLGGMGSQVGVVIASIALIGGFEFFREAEQFRMLIFGLAMVVIMVWKPRGLVSTRIPSIFLKEKKAVSSDMVAQGEGH
ncbi:high-affinity branched-chain amino acid ABC transporter permease LivM [Sneathiella glossodoripedis]|uniref:high-affinity branched-chain amino acid ABC transporter permease LivM n=1 Tax=Sneathiella glossodoripedis TaxID=418853 RepID=UPI00047271B6|nr:high-affinity branched-chain amino acid ABC transporter permease LivM [Sneathiella glossodoripedis]